MVSAPWSKREKDILRSRWALNWRAGTIGAEIGRSESAVWRQAWLLQLPRRKFDQEGVKIAKRRGSKSDTIERKCLGCTNPFDSTGPGNRMCDACRKRTSNFPTVYA